MGVESSPRLDAQGALVFSTEGGAVRLKKPVVYQEIGGKRRAVEGRFVLFEPQARHSGMDCRNPGYRDVNRTPSMVLATYRNGHEHR